MKELILDSLELHYFKGAAEKTIKFDPKVTNIYADNRVGKTTVFDAFTWLLFGKDSLGNSVGDNFDIKTLDENNVAIPDVEHTVEGVLMINGVKTVLKKSYCEDWTGKRGGTPHLTGHHNECWYNGVPTNVNDYNAFVDSIIPEELFKLLTNPLYFNSLNKVEKRQILISLAGEISDQEIADGNEAFKALISKMDGRNRNAYKVMIKAQEEEKENALKKISTRIDEQTATMPATEDWGAIEKEIENIETERDKIQETLLSANGLSKEKRENINRKWDRVSAIQDERRRIITERNTAERKQAEDSNKELYAKKRELCEIRNGAMFDAQRAVDDLANNIKTSKSKLAITEGKIKAKMLEWSEANNKTFKPGDCLICPIYNIKCNDEAATIKHEEAEEDAQIAFNTRKADTLRRIDEEGQILSLEKKQYNEAIANAETELLLAKEELSKIEKQYSALEYEIAEIPEVGYTPITAGTCNDKVFLSLVDEENKIRAEIDDLKKSDESQQLQTLRSRSNDLTSQILNLNKRLQARETIKEKTNRIAELEQQKINIGQEISEIDSDKDTLRLFERAVDNELQERINGRFRFVKFRLFKENIGDGDKEVCDTLINGVPYNSANNEAKINAGIDIINALQEKYETLAPVWLDNRESVNDLEPTNAQLINLIVSRDKFLRIDYSL